MTVVPETPATTVPEGTSVPEIVIPTTMPVIELKEVIEKLPFVTVPVGVTLAGILNVRDVPVRLVLAAWEIVMELAPTDRHRGSGCDTGSCYKHSGDNSG